MKTIQIRFWTGKREWGSTIEVARFFFFNFPLFCIIEIQNCTHEFSVSHPAWNKMGWIGAWELLLARVVLSRRWNWLGSLLCCGFNSATLESNSSFENKVHQHFLFHPIYSLQRNCFNNVLQKRQLHLANIFYMYIFFLYWRYNPVWVFASSVVPAWSSGGFVTVNFTRMVSLAPRPTSSLDNQGLHFVWPLPFDLSGMGGSTWSFRSRQHSSPGPGGKSPFHDMEVVLEKDTTLVNTVMNFRVP
jgi:hypothetical protein